MATRTWYHGTSSAHDICPGDGARPGTYATSDRRTAEMYARWVVAAIGGQPEVWEMVVDETEVEHLEEHGVPCVCGRMTFRWTTEE